MYVDAEARTGNPDARRYVEMWQSLPYHERIGHMPEQICELTTIPAADLVSWVGRQAWIEHAAGANMCLSFMKADVLEQTAAFALASPDNYKDRELFLKVAGMTPQPTRTGGPVFFNMPVASSNSVAGAKSDAAPATSSGLRSMDEDIVELAKIMQTDGSEVHARAQDIPNEPDDEDDDDEEDDDE
jgi:hypothetical protein